MSSARGYRLYGLTLHSPWALPCPRAKLRASADVRFSAGSADRFFSARSHVPQPSGPDGWFCARQLPDGSTYLRWTGLFEFLISPNGRQVLYHRLEHASQESFNVYLLGQVLSFSLLAFGTEPLHGTAVVIDGEAIVLLGNCGYGKSTLGAALLARGFPILTDDLIVLDEGKRRWSVHRGIPRIKLFPSIARRVLKPKLDGSPMNNGTSKLVLPLGGSQMARATAPLKALYVLSDPKPHARAERVRIEHLSGGEAFLELIRAAFNLIVLERWRLTNQFGVASRLAATVPIKRLTYPRKLSSLPAVCDAVLADLTA